MNRIQSLLRKILLTTVSGLLGVLLVLPQRTQAQWYTAKNSTSPLSCNGEQVTANAGRDFITYINTPTQFYGFAATPLSIIISYEWDFNGDGIFDYQSSTSAITSYTYLVPGNYAAILQVTDLAGNRDRDSVVVEVLSGTGQQEYRPQVERMQLAEPAQTSPADGIVKRYAILINGSNEARFWDDVSFIYSTLLNDYHTPEGQIYLLNSEGMSPNGTNPNAMIDGPATTDSLSAVMNTVAAQVDADDQVFIWVTDHGNGYAGTKTGYHGYLAGRASIDPGDEQDYLERDFKLRSFIASWYGEVRNMGLNTLLPSSNYDALHQATVLYRTKYVSQFTNVDFEQEGVKSDSDVYIEQLVDYVLGDTSRDGRIDTNAGEQADYDGDGIPPYDRLTDSYDEDDWGKFDTYTDNLNYINTLAPGDRYMIFDQGLDGRVDIDINYDPNHLTADGTDLDNQGLFDGIDINDDGDMDDWISIDETIELATGRIYDDEFATLLNQLNSKVMSIFMEQCYSGGFIEDLSAPNRVISTAAEEETPSWGNLFVELFTSALHQADRAGSPIDVDTDHNGCISMVESFNYAALYDTNAEIPQYDDNGDRVGHTKIIPNGGDGSLGSQTYLGDCQSSTTIVVNSTTDPGDGVCNQIECTLREAFILVNTQPSADIIQFSIPGEGPHIIQLGASLPPLIGETVVDGFSQLGAKPNSNPIDQPINAIIKIEIAGQLELYGRNITIQGLAIHGGIHAYGRNGTIVGNFIGTDASGTLLPTTPQKDAGIEVLVPATAVIGGSLPAARNLIAGFADGIFNYEGDALIQGNFIGTDVTGEKALGNRDGVVSVGRSEIRNNLISGNQEYGIRVSSFRAWGTTIHGNSIGTTRTGTTALSNGKNGIWVTSAAATIANNRIAWNQEAGISIESALSGSKILDNEIFNNDGNGIEIISSTDGDYASLKQTITGNLIYGNGSLGLDLKKDGVTVNDLTDMDEGPNHLQNYPVLTKLEHGGNNTVVVGVLNSKPNSSYHVELFYGLTCDESGYGEGEKLLTGLDITTDSSGTREFGVKLSTLPDGYYVTATATDNEGNSSEFSKCIRVSLPPARITIMKEAQPKSMQDFAYYGPFGKFYLDDAQPDDGDGFGSFKTFEVNAGTYNFAEGVFQSWYLADIICSGTGSTVKDMTNRSIAITVKRGDQMSCTFVTQRRVNLQAIKFNDLNGDGIRQPSEPTLTPWEFRFYKSDGTLINHKVTDANGSAVQNNVIPGSFQVCETPKAGWTNTLPGQVDPSLQLPCYNLTLQPGQNASLLFGNTQAPIVRSGEGIDPLSGVAVDELPDINEPESEEGIEPEFTQRLFLPLISH